MNIVEIKKTFNEDINESRMLNYRSTQTDKIVNGYKLTGKMRIKKNSQRPYVL